MSKNSKKTWESLLKPSACWQWDDGKLWHRLASRQAEKPATGHLQYWFVKMVYADQNSSSAVREQLDALMHRLDNGGVGLNIGCGEVRFPGVINLEISDGPQVDIVGHGTELPFKDNTLDLVIMQEVLEHVDDFQSLLDEVRRVLKPGARCYCQVPFQIGFHPGPADYWRFSRQGIEYIFRAPEWRIEKVGISLGHGSGFYRIAVEFFAVTASCLHDSLYKPFKMFGALVLYPVKFLDQITKFSSQRDRIPGGYFCVAAKTLASPAPGEVES